MQQNLGALDMPQKLQAKTCALGGAFDDAWNIRHHKTAIRTHHDHAEHRVQSRERVVGHLGSRRRNAADQGRFAGIRQPQQANVREQLKFQFEAAAFGGHALRDAARRAVRAAFEMGVAEAMKAALANQDPGALGSQIAQGFIAFEILDEGANRHRNLEIIARNANAIPAHPGLPVARLETPPMAKIDQSIQARGPDDIHAPPIAAIPSIRPAVLNEFFSPKTQTAVPTLPRVHGNHGFIGKFHLARPFRGTPAPLGVLGTRCPK